MSESFAHAQKQIVAVVGLMGCEDENFDGISQNNRKYKQYFCLFCPSIFFLSFQAYILKIERFLEITFVK